MGQKWRGMTTEEKAPYQVGWGPICLGYHGQGSGGVAEDGRPSLGLVTGLPAKPLTRVDLAVAVGTAIPWG
jgi:hypothetical protein